MALQTAALREWSCTIMLAVNAVWAEPTTRLLRNRMFSLTPVYATQSCASLTVQTPSTRSSKF